MAHPVDRRSVLKTIAGTALAAAGSTGTSAQIRSADAQQSLQSSWTVVAPGIWKARLGDPETHTPSSSRRFPPDTRGLTQLPTVQKPAIRSPDGRRSSRGVEFTLPLEENELMYGFGLQLLSFQQRSKKRTIRVNADPKVDSGDTHAPVPFYVTTRGYGLLVDTFRHASFYCGQVHPRPERGSAGRTLEVNTPQMMRKRERGQLSQVLVEVPRCQGVDVYLFGGPEMCSAVQRYNLYAGGGVLPPEWGLGFWYRPEMHLRADEVLALARDLRAAHIPCDVLGLEPGWQTHAYSCTFAWESERFPQPTHFLQSARDAGFHINLWEHAFTHPASPVFADLQPHTGNFAVWGGLVPDFAGTSARKIFGEYHGRALIDLGVSGFKLDECDNSDFTEGWSFPDNSRFPSGMDGEQMHAQFGLRYQDAILEQFEQRKRPTYNLVRSSGTFATPYPFVLYSDLYDHRQFIRALVNSGFSGLLWCPEVRDAASELDLIRRLESVVFSPLAMVNAWYIRNPPWKQIDRDKNNANDFSPACQQLEARCREIISWRMQLIPYLRGAFAAYRQQGLPPFRALIMDWTTDNTLSEVDDQYLVGDRMMVAPLFAGEPTRTVIFPAGDWHDFWTGARVQTRRLVLHAPERIPVFVKGGSVLPWAAVGSHEGTPETRQLEARIYGDGALPWSLPETLGGLHLSWNATAQQGVVKQNGTGADRYDVRSWKRMQGT